jgi:methylthioribose-1-phosphate isomerase
MGDTMRTIEWSDRGTVKMYDQRKLPLEVVIVDFDDYRDVARSIQEMYIRGARPRSGRRFWKRSDRF